MQYRAAIANFFKGHERTVKAKKNIVISFVLKGLSVAISLVLVPLTINYVNPTRYGIWLTLTSIISWFAFFDIGFGNGLRNKLAEAIAKENDELGRSYLSTAYGLFAGVFGSIWIIFILVNRFINWSDILNAPSEINHELQWLAFIIFTYLCLQFMLQPINIVLTADQKPAKAAAIDVIGQAIALIFIFILTKTTRGSLINLGVGLGLSPVLITLIASLWYYRKRYQNLYPSAKKIDYGCIRDIMGLGVKFFLLQISCVVIFQTNNIVIAHISGPDDVTVYNVAYKYFSVISILFMIILNPFWSAFTDAYVRNDTDWMKNTVKKLENLWMFVAFGGVFLLLFSRYFFPLWLGEKVIVPFGVSVFLLLYFLIYTRFNLYIILLNGIGKIQIQMLVYFPLALINIPLIILLGQKFGLEGMIFGNILVSIPHIIYGPLQLKKIIGNRATGLWNR